MLFIVATKVVASRPLERRPTGTPHACANRQLQQKLAINLVVLSLALLNTTVSFT